MQLELKIKSTYNYYLNYLLLYFNCVIIILLGIYFMISQICLHVWNAIIVSFTTKMSSCKITKDFKQNSYKICQHIIEQIRNNLNIYQALYYSYYLNLGP